nr:MAG TPA: hypothetical protein [Bacteriophage sp.]
MALINRIAQLGPAFEKVNARLQKNLIGPLSGGIGSAIGNVGGKILGKGIDLINAARKVDYKSVGRAGLEKGKHGVGYTLHGLSNEAEYVGRSASLLRKQLLGDAPITTNYLGADHPITKLMKKTALFKRDDASILLGAKATKLGVGVIFAGSLVSGVPKAAQDYMLMQKGQNDGTVRTNAPVNNYAQQMANQRVGSSYANNAGATGDLVFALHNQRHSGIL